MQCVFDGGVNHTTHPLHADLTAGCKCNVVVFKHNKQVCTVRLHRLFSAA